MSNTLTLVRAQLMASVAAIDEALKATPAAVVRLDLPKPAAFFDHVRGRLWPRMSVSQVQGCERIIAACGYAQFGLAWTAYVLATAYHESGYRMQPIKELGGDAYLAKYDTGRLAARLGNTPEADGDGVLYAGRGDVMVTGLDNYRRATVELRRLGVIGEDVDLTKTPDRMLEPAISGAALIYGMRDGWWTGKALTELLPVDGPATVAQFTRARPIVNGTDRAAMIAGYAIDFQAALFAGGWA